MDHEQRERHCRHRNRRHRHCTLDKEERKIEKTQKMNDAGFEEEKVDEKEIGSS